MQTLFGVSHESPRGAGSLCPSSQSLCGETIEPKQEKQMTIEIITDDDTLEKVLRAPIRSVEIDLRERFIRIGEEILKESHSDNRSAAKAYLEGVYVPEVKAILNSVLIDSDRIRQLLANVNRKKIDLRQGPPMPMPATEVERISPPLLSRYRWCGLELDILRDYLRMGDKIVGYNGIGVTLSDGRTITRIELRSRRPISWTNTRTWDAQFSGYEVSED
jgi:hypothetical protein